MSEGLPFSAKEFGASFKGFLDQVAAQAPGEEPVFVKRLREHFGTDPTKLPIVTEQFVPSEHPNLHLALESYLAEPGRSAELVGVHVEHRFRHLSLTQLVAPERGGMYGAVAPTEGPVLHVNLALKDDEVLTCVQVGLYQIRSGSDRLAVLFDAKDEMGYNHQLNLEVMAAERSLAERFLAEIRTSMRKRNVYRGQVLSLSLDRSHSVEVNFHRLPSIGRDQIILPSGLLDRIERQTVGFDRQREKLLTAGRHLKRGMLLFGPPGTGKTLTAMFLASQMKGRTVFLLTGRGMGLIEQSCSMARMLQPSTVILEDVDMVAEERSRQEGCTPLLFELLNQMDGLADDADVLFLLTTNRPEILEPALAARPGRVDQAIEIPLPDADCRRRLFELYGKGLRLELMDRDRFIRKTEGVSAAFIRELMRKAALFAADEGEEVVVVDRHMDEAMHELLVEGGPLTKSLLGARVEAETP